jgi:hypothetical protein
MRAILFGVILTILAMPGAVDGAFPALGSASGLGVSFFQDEGQQKPDSGTPSDPPSTTPDGDRNTVLPPRAEPPPIDDQVENSGRLTILQTSVQQAPIVDRLEENSQVSVVRSPGTAEDLGKLAAELKALIAAREDAANSAQGIDNQDPAETIRLRLRLADLLVRLSTQKKEKKPKPESPPSTFPRVQEAVPELKKPPEKKTARDGKELRPKNLSAKASVMDGARPGASRENALSADRSAMPRPDPGQQKPVEPMALAQALYRTGDYEGALATYRLINPATVDRMNRVGLQYMIATCLRKLARTDEAAAAYREVVNSRDDPFLTDCAQWQLSALRWRRDLETRLQEIRRKNEAMDTKQ